jgi:hypothetical protein
MKLVDITMNVAYHKDSEAMIIIVEQESGELNIYDFNSSRMCVYSESSYHDYLEPMYEDSEDTTLKETDWEQLQLSPLTSLSEIELVHKLVKEFSK